MVNLTLEEATEWLHKNAGIISLSAIATRLGIDVSNLHKAVTGGVATNGYTVKIPKRCLPELLVIISEFQIPAAPI